jgi:hypothetical protein
LKNGNAVSNLQSVLGLGRFLPGILILSYRTYAVGGFYPSAERYSILPVRSVSACSAETLRTEGDPSAMLPFVLSEAEGQAKSAASGCRTTQLRKLYFFCIWFLHS